jgi:hypothetical protein
VSELNVRGMMRCLRPRLSGQPPRGTDAPRYISSLSAGPTYSIQHTTYNIRTYVGMLYVVDTPYLISLCLLALPFRFSAQILLPFAH